MKLTETTLTNLILNFISILSSTHKARDQEEEHVVVQVGVDVGARAEGAQQDRQADAQTAEGVQQHATHVGDELEVSL